MGLHDFLIKNGFEVAWFAEKGQKNYIESIETKLKQNYLIVSGELVKEYFSEFKKPLIELFEKDISEYHVTYKKY